MRIVLKRDVRGASGIIDKREVADVVVGVFGVAFGFAPAIGQPAVRVVFVTEDFDAGLVHLVGHPAIQVVIPGSYLVLAVFEADRPIPCR